MCIAIIKKYGAKISDDKLINSFRANHDGAGIAYTVGNKLIVEKGIFNENEFVEKVRLAEKIAEGDMLIHCRIGTSGNYDKNNTHPHWINDDLCMIHNGILDVKVPKDSPVSDTVIFIEEYLKDMPKDFYKNKAILKLLGEFIRYNKFCFLDNKGMAYCCNEDMGHWLDGVWFSNSSYESFNTYNWNNNYTATISKDVELKLAHNVNTVTAEQLAVIRNFPMVDVKTGELVKYNEKRYTKCEIEYLEDIDADLFDKYIDIYYTYLEYTEDLEVLG